MAKRPFTTSSLTSTLKSTLANQPLLGNLTNIDKISSQASSLAQKSSFLDAINQQFQNQSGGGGNANSSTNSQRATSPAGSNNSTASNAVNSKDMTRDVHHAGPTGARPPADNAPAVDMSHLTEEERLMIQSVMAKAKMADMGIPVDTSMPSSTNLPSSTSQALTQQRDQQQQQQRQNQQQQNQQNQQQHEQTRQPQMQNQNQYQPGSSTASGFGFSNSQQSQAKSMQPQTSNSAIQNNSNQMSSQMQSGIHQSQQPTFQAQLNQGLANMNTSFDAQQGFMMDSSSQQAMNQPQMQQRKQLDTFMSQPMGMNQNDSVLTTQSQQPSLEQQTRQLVSQINSEFNLGGSQAQQQTQQQATQQQQQQQAVQFGFSGNQDMQQPAVNQNQMLSDNGTLLQQNQFPMNNNNNNNHMQSGQLGGMGNRPMFMEEPQSQLISQPSLVGGSQNQLSSLNSQIQNDTFNGRPNQMFNMVGPDMFSQVETRTNVPQQIPQQMLAQNRVDSFMIPANQLSPQFASLNLAGDLSMIDRANMSAWPGQSFDQVSMQQRKVSRRTMDETSLRHGSDHNMTSDLDYEQSFSDHDLQRNSSRNRRRKAAAQASRRHELTKEDSTARQRKLTEQQEKESVRRRAQQASGQQKSRQLPQPGCSSQGKKSPSKTSRSLSNDFDEGETSRSPTRQTARSNSRPTNKNVAKHMKESPVYLTDSDLEENTLSAESSIEKKPPSPDPPKAKTTNQSTEPEKFQTKEKGEAEKSNKALQLLNELKLSEQANQVMEQQQLLIRQSQELIKLQQAQLEQAVSRRTLASQKIPEAVTRDENRTDSFDSFRSGDDMNSRRNGSVNQQSSDTPSAANAEPRIESTKLDSERMKIVKDTATQSSKNGHADSGDFESDSSFIDQQRTRGTSIHSTNLEDIDCANDLNAKIQRQSESRGAKQSQTPNSAISQTLLRQNNRDLIQSPTDTTDSDADFFSQAGQQRRHQKTPTKTKEVQRRREPRGLPPSPLPVAAAIQLHHMQQQHLRQQTTTKPDNLTRANFLRSRSVTSSPNHMLHRYTGTSRTTRPTSPDTMSEFGGTRRRKCLPEPPANVVPLTPSIVRRLIQAQKAAAAGNQTSLPSSYTTTTQANSFIDRSLATNRLINDRVRSSLDALNVKYPLSSSMATDRWNPSESSLGIGSRLPYSSRLPDRNLDLSINRPNSQVIGQTSGSDFIAPILKSSSIADVKETPELDKLISNLDEYYGLDSKRSNKPAAKSYQLLTDNQPSSSSLLNSSMNYTDSLLSPARRLTQTQPSRYTGYASRPSYQTGLSAQDMLMRRNSEGQARQYSSSYTPMSYSQQSTDYRPSAYTTTTGPQTYRANVQLPTDPNVYPSSSGLHSNYRSPSQRKATDFTANSRLDNYGWHTAQNATPLGSTVPQANQQYYKPSLDFHSSSYSEYHNTRPPTESYRATSSQYDNNIDQYYHDTVARTQPVTAHSSGTSTQASHWNRYSNNMAPLSKDDIINNGPKFSSIGYRFRTENQNKYVAEMRTPIECLQSRYPYPYKRILLSKNPKDRIGNGIGVKIIGGQPMSNVYDQVNKCIITSGAFVTEVFQSGRVHFLNEMHEGDQIIEWNGVNLCNRSDEEVQQILLSQFSDDEVEIIYLNHDKFYEAYGAGAKLDSDYEPNYGSESAAGDSFDVFAGLNKAPSDYYAQVRSPWADSTKRSIRRKLSLSSISHMWSK